jgi:hypothetical protein
MLCHLVSSRFGEMEVYLDIYMYLSENKEETQLGFKMMHNISFCLSVCVCCVCCLCNYGMSCHFFVVIILFLYFMWTQLTFERER